MTAFEGWRASGTSKFGNGPQSGESPGGATSRPDTGGDRNRLADAASTPELADSARLIKETVKDNAQEALSQARRGADRLIDQQKSLASERLEGYAASMRQAAGCLTEQNPQIGRLLDTTAGRLGSVGTYLREHQVSDMMRQVNRFGREHPLILLGGMFVAGALAARFFKASQQRSQREFNGDDGENGFEQYAQAPFISGRTEREHRQPPQRTQRDVRSEMASGVCAVSAGNEHDMLKGGLE